MNRTLTIVVSALGVLLIVILGAILFLMIREDESSSDEVAQGTATLVAVETAQPTVAQAATELPPPVVEVLPTVTPLPTSTPAPTDTPLPTDTPAPTATNTPVPVIIRPTNTPVPPTNTPAPPPPDTRGLTALGLRIQDRSSYTRNGQIWFDFQIVNNAGGEVAYNSLGVMPRKDGADRLDWYQHSYGGPNASIKTGGLTHEDNIKLPESGNYTLRLVICFDGYDTCLSGGGTWVPLSQEISITIN